MTNDHTTRFDKIKEAMAEFEASVDAEETSLMAEAIKQAFSQATFSLTPYGREDIGAKTYMIEAYSDLYMDDDDVAESPQTTITKLVMGAGLEECFDGSYHRQIIAFQAELVNCLQYVNDIVFKAAGRVADDDTDDTADVVENMAPGDARPAATLYFIREMVARTDTNGETTFNWPAIERMSTDASTEFSRGVASMLLAARLAVD